MNIKKTSAFGKITKISLLTIIIVSLGYYVAVVNTVNAMPSLEEMEAMQNMSEEEKNLEDRTIKAKKAFERNQTRLRVARNIATSTVSQLKLEGTDVEELLKNLKEFEERMDEIEELYNKQLNGLLLFERNKEEDPGDIEKVFNQAREKKEDLVAFYKNTFRNNLEDALVRNEKEKEAN